MIRPARSATASASENVKSKDGDGAKNHWDEMDYVHGGQQTAKELTKRINSPEKKGGVGKKDSEHRDIAKEVFFSRNGTTRFDCESISPSGGVSSGIRDIIETACAQHDPAANHK